MNHKMANSQLFHFVNSNTFFRILKDINLKYSTAIENNCIDSWILMNNSTAGLGSIAVSQPLAQNLIFKQINLPPWAITFNILLSIQKNQQNL